ncbi:MAG: hypothetical protein ACOH12_06690 [Parvibaculaceae bacterium]
MAKFVVAYDLDKGDQSDYTDLTTEIDSYDSVRTQKSVWLVACDKTRKELFDALKAHIHENDFLMVIEFSSKPSGTKGLTGTKAWIDGNFP